MKKGLFTRYFLSMLLVACIGFMQYALVTDSSPDIASTRRHTFQKAQESHDFISDFNDDDDEDVSCNKHFAQQFVHAYVCSTLQLIVPSVLSEASPRSIVSVSTPQKHPIYQQVNSYRI